MTVETTAPRCPHQPVRLTLPKAPARFLFPVCISTCSSAVMHLYVSAPLNQSHAADPLPPVVRSRAAFSKPTATTKKKKKKANRSAAMCSGTSTWRLGAGWWTPPGWARPKR